MEDNMDMNVEDFFGAFEGEDGNQTDTQEETAEVEETESEAETEGTEQEGEEDADGGETAESDDSEADKDGAEASSEPDNSKSEQKFVVKVNKETREVSYQDAPVWIQKGMDYDRVKNQLEVSQQSEQSLQAELDKHRPVLDLLSQMAQEQKMEIPEMLDHVMLSMLIGQGMTGKEAQATLRAMKAERKANSEAEKKEPPAEETPAAEDENDRAVREVQEFMQNFPDVQLNDQQIAAMKPYVQKGMSMTTAYLMVEKARLEDAAKQKEAAEAARVKNSRNRAKSPGSQRDSGGQRTKDATDDFFAAFEK